MDCAAICVDFGGSAVTYWGGLGEFTAALWPPPNVPNRVNKIDAGYYHLLALLPDGTVRAVGRDKTGQLKVPPGLSGVSEIAAGGVHSLALVNGQVIGWGAEPAATVPPAAKGGAP